MDYGNLAEYQRERALQTKMHLDLLVHLGKLDESLLRGRVLDWGAGQGTNTQALNNFGGYVEAIDISDAVDLIVERGVLPKERVYKQNGLQFLRDRPDTYDLITSFLFGPLQRDGDRQFLREFYEAARVGVKPEGKILLTSDIGSFRCIEELAQEGYGEVLRFPTFPYAYIGRKAEAP